MKKVFALALVAFAVIGFMTAPSFAEALTDGQQNSLEMLLRSFGADDSTIRNFQGAVLGATTGPTDDYGSDGTSTSGVYCPKLSSTMQRGSRDATTGGQVTELQLFLSDYFNLNEEDIATGFFGRLSQSYVVKFQQEKGLPAFGIVGSLTRAKILEWCGKGQTGTTGTTPVTPTVPTGTSPLSETNSSAGLSYTLTLSGALVSGELSFVEGKDIGPFVLTVKNVSSTTRSVTFPNNCWYAYTIYDGFNGGRSVFDLSSIQKCVSAESSTSKTFTLKPGDSFYLDITHKFQTAHIPSGDYSMLIKLNTQLGAQSVAKFNFKVWAREPDSTSATLTASPSFGALSTTGGFATLWVDFNVSNYKPRGTEIIDFGDGTYSALGYTTNTNARHDYHATGAYTVKLYKDSAKAEVIAQTVVTVTSNTTPTTSVSSVFSVSLDASSPGYKIVAANTQSVHTGSFKFRTGNDDVYLYKLAIIANKSVPGIQKVSVYEGMGDGAPKIGEGYFIGAGATASVMFTRQILLPKNSEKVLQVRADVGSIGISEPVNTSGDFIQLNYGNAWGKSGLTGADVSPTGSVEVAGIRVMKSFPTVVLDDSLSSGNLADGRLMRFKVSADSRGPVGLTQFFLNVSHSGLAAGGYVSNISVYAYSDSNYSSPIPGVSSDGNLQSQNDCPSGCGVGENINIGISTASGALSAIQIPAGQTRYFEVRGSVSGTQNGSAVTTKLIGDRAFGGIVSATSLVGKDAYFIWSPNSVTTAVRDTIDWTTGYAVPGLPSSGLVYTRIQGGVSPVQTPLISITSAGHVDADTGTAFNVEYGNMPSSGVNVVNVGTGATVWTQELTSGGNGTMTFIVRPAVPAGEYVLQAFNSSRTVIATSPRYTIGSVTPVPIVTISVNPSTISTTQSSTLTWATQNANRCYLTYGSVQESVATSGTWTVNPAVTTKYTLRCANDPGTGKDGPVSEASVTLTVSSTTSSGELYAVGVYEATGAQHNFCYSKSGTVNVNLVQLVGSKKGTPVILSLSAYEPVIWNINVPAGVNLQKVILSGYNVQSPVITGASPLVERYFYNDPANAARGISPAGSFYDEREGADSRFQTIYNWAGQATCANTSGAVPIASRWYYNPGSNYFYAYQKTDSNYSTLVSKLQSLTGLTLKNFQGSYSGSTFTVTVGSPEY